MSSTALRNAINRYVARNPHVIIEIAARGEHYCKEHGLDPDAAQIIEHVAPLDDPPGAMDECFIVRHPGFKDLEGEYRVEAKIDVLAFLSVAYPEEWIAAHYMVVRSMSPRKIDSEGW